MTCTYVHAISLVVRRQIPFCMVSELAPKMKSALVLLALLSFLTKFSALGLPRVDYNQFAKSLLPHGLFYVISIDIVADDYDIMQRYNYSSM